MIRPDRADDWKVSQLTIGRNGGAVTEPADLTLGKAAERFLHSLDAEERAQTQADLQGFLRWHGKGRKLSEMRPADLESYTSSVSANAVHGRQQLTAVRALLGYAKRAGLTRDNLGVHVRVARGGDKAKAAASSGPVVRLTAEGFEQLERELDDLRAQRPRLAEDLRLAMADKDFRENAPLDAAREQQAHIEARIRDIEVTLRQAVVLRPDDQGDRGEAHVGATVQVSNLTDGSVARYTLVERSEVNPSKGKISIHSPVGQALLGRMPGDEVDVQVPGGVRRFRLETIEAP